MMVTRTELFDEIIEKSRIPNQVAEARELALMNYSPVKIGELLYHRSGRDDFWEEVFEHMVNAFLISTPRHFMMFRAIQLDDGRAAWLVNSGVSAGTLFELINLFPFELNWIAFHRRNKPRLHVWPFERFKRIAKELNERTTSTSTATA
jgi:hypothetical protein